MSTRKLLGYTSLDLKLEPTKTSDSPFSFRTFKFWIYVLIFAKDFDPRIRQRDGLPIHDESLKDNQGKHMSCPQNVEEEGRNTKSTQVAIEQIILQLAENIWVKSKLYLSYLQNPKHKYNAFVSCQKC